MEHPFKIFEVYPDYIKIDSHTFERPNYISDSQWVDFWDLDGLKSYFKTEIKSLDEELEWKEDQINELHGGIKYLESEVSSLEEEVSNLEHQIDELKSGD